MGTRIPIPNPMALDMQGTQPMDTPGWAKLLMGDVDPNRVAANVVRKWNDMINGMTGALAAPGKAYNGGYDLLLDPNTGENYYGGMAEDATNLAGMLTLGAGAVPAEAGALRMGLSKPQAARDGFQVRTKDASDIFGSGASTVRYVDPSSKGYIEVVARPNGSASVLGLEVPEQFRGKGIGQSLQDRVMQDFPMMQGQVSSKAAATTAYRLGRRPVRKPDASLEDVFKMIDEDSSVNLVSPEMQRYYTK